MVRDKGWDVNAEQYNSWSKPLRDHPHAARALVLANRAITALYYLAYPLLIAWLFLQGDPLAWRVLLAPLSGFILVAIMRKALNRPRPYETLDIQPLIPKDTQGASFPSRHSYSAIVISMSYLNWWAPTGIIMLLIGCCMACIRVLGGVHYPSDVLVGAGLGVLFGLMELLVLW